MNVDSSNNEKGKRNKNNGEYKNHRSRCWHLQTSKKKKDLLHKVTKTMRSIDSADRGSNCPYFRRVPVSGAGTAYLQAENGGQAVTEQQGQSGR